MEATRIRALTRRILDARSTEYSMRKNRLNELRQAMVAAKSELDIAFNTFAHTQLLQNTAAYGEEVNELANKAAIEIEQHRTTVSEFEKALHRLDDEIASRNMEIELARAEVQAQLQADETFAALKIAVNKRYNAVVLAEAECGKLLDEVAQKLPEFETNAAFQYLLKAGFGTPDYSRSGVIARLDGALARRTQFLQNKESYAILLGIKAEATARSIKFNDEYREALDHYEEYEKKAYDTATIKELARGLSDLEAERLENSASLASVLEQEKIFLTSTGGSGLAAKQLIVKILLQRDKRTLASLADSTSSTEDDNALDVIQEALATIESIESELNAAQGAFHASATGLAKAKELSYAIESDLRLSGGHYRYPSEMFVTEILNRFVAGNLERAELIKLLRSQCIYVPRSPVVVTAPTTHTGTNQPHVPPTRLSTPSSTFSTRGSVGGGSFKTTDSF